MAASGWRGLSGGVPGPDPWVERDRLTAGQPAAIHGLADTFHAAAREAASASASGAKASLKTGESYRVDGHEVHAVDAQTGRTRELLSGSGEDLDRIAKILHGVGDDLTTTAGSAASQVADLEGQLAVFDRNFADYEGRYRAARAAAVLPGDIAMLDKQYESELSAFRDRSVDAAQQTGTSVARLVSEYDDMLGLRSRELAALGFTVPAAVNQGPGDIESDPDAARRDAAAVAEALDHPPGRQTLAEIDAAASELRVLNEKAERGEQLTAADRGYLNQFYEALGAEDLARLPEHLRAAVQNADPGMPPPVANGTADGTLQPFGDSIINLSQGVRYESLPAPVRELLDTRLGYVDPDTGIRHLNDRFLQSSNYPGGSNPTDYVLGGGVAGMNRLSGISDVLRSSSRTPGTELATHLADAAIRARQDLNAGQDMARRGLHFMGDGSQDAITGLDAIVDDSAASTMLSVAARNNEASSAALIDDDRRAAILGLNWEDAGGATAIVDSGTDRIPQAGGGTRMQAEAALAVVREVGGDRDGYLDRMADPLKDTVNHVGLHYLEAFAEPPVDPRETKSGLTDNRTNAMDQQYPPSFQLTPDDRNHFLQFVSGSGEDRATRFDTQARIFGQAGIADALVNGDPGQLMRAMETAGRLDGVISQGHFDLVADRVGGQDAAAAAAARVQTIDARVNQATLNTFAAGGKEAIGLAIGLVPGGGVVKAVGGPTFAILTEMVKGEISVQSVPGAPASPALPQTMEDLRREDHTWATRQQNLALAGAMDSAGLFDDGNRPAILTYDANADGVIDSPGSNSENQSTLGPRLATELDRWGLARAAPGTNGVVNQNAYLDGRNQGFTGDRDGTGAPSDSAWTKDDRLFYGQETPEGVLFSRERDTRRLDDPKWELPR